jgi:hypothetical protein
LRRGGGLLRCRNACRPDQSVTGDDGVTGNQEGVLTIDQRGVGVGGQHADGGFGTVTGSRCQGVQLAVSGFATEYGADGQVLAGRDDSRFAGIQIGRLVLQDVTEVLLWVMTGMAYSFAMSFLTALTIGEASGREISCVPASALMVD